jgi:hypothetical protein
MDEQQIHNSIRRTCNIQIGCTMHCDTPLCAGGSVSLLGLGSVARPHKKRFAVRRKASTDPDAAKMAVMLSMLPTAVDKHEWKRPAGAAGLARSDLIFDRFLVAIMNPLGSGCK